MSRGVLHRKSVGVVHRSRAILCRPPCQTSCRSIHIKHITERRSSTCLVLTRHGTYSTTTGVVGINGLGAVLSHALPARHCRTRALADSDRGVPPTHSGRGYGDAAATHQPRGLPAAAAGRRRAEPVRPHPRAWCQGETLSAPLLLARCVSFTAESRATASDTRVAAASSNRQSELRWLERRLVSTSGCLPHSGLCLVDARGSVHITHTPAANSTR